MCGISGFIHFENSIDKKSTIEKMNTTLKHRGPDSSNYWSSDDNYIYLGHTRLSIIDLSVTGNQPMISRSKRYVIVFNGEIYNHLNIRGKLSFNNWKGTSDTETLLECINELGIFKTLELLSGMFAFAVYDTFEKNIYLCRDRIGEKPLYYYFYNNQLIFASELKALFKHTGIKKELNYNSLNLYLKYNYIPSPQSIYKNILKLEQSTVATFKINNNKTISKSSKKYWSTKNKKNNFKHSTDTDLINLLDNKITNSVGLQMNADVSTGSFLSGGIDSSLISSVMSKISDKKINTFTIGFENQEYDESRYAKNISNFLGSKHHYHLFKPQEVISIIDRLDTVYDEPFADSSQLPTILLSQFASKYIKVALSGDGADELFGGYNRYKYIKLIHNLSSKIPSKFRNPVSKILLNIHPKFYEILYKMFNLISFGNIKYSDPVDKFYKILRILNKDNVLEMYLELLSHQGFEKKILKQKNNFIDVISHDLNLSFKDDDFLNSMMEFDINNYLADDILVKVDRAAMSHSLETRAPFLDKEIVDFSINLDSRFKIKNKESKWILKKILEKYLPSELYQRPKKGFGVPIGSWLKNDLREWSVNHLNSKLIEDQGIFNHKIINNLFEDHLKGKTNNHYILWNILVFQNWYFKNF
tara:strand:+ start:4122 stop:6056 length:1935 start_codon:yes stop_codon:yes gene_type:complete